MSKLAIVADGAPAATGTYSQAVRAGGLVFVTGQTGRHPSTGLLEDGLDAQTHRTFANVEAILGGAGCSPADLVKVTLLLANIKDFKAVDDIYKVWLPDRDQVALPARTALEAAALPAGALLMLEVVAVCPEP